MNNKIAIRKSIVLWRVKAVRAFQTVRDSIKTICSGFKFERRMSKQQTLQSPAPSFLKKILQTVGDQRGMHN